MKLGFIGLGIMGLPMAKNLLKAGYDIVAYDLSKSRVDDICEAGAAAAGSVAEVASQSEIIITMLPNSPHVKEVICGEAGILSACGQGLVIIDMSSIAPFASKEIAVACAAKGVRMIDAPVSGGEPKAVDGTLSIMVGGDRDVYEKVKDILLTVGDSAVYCGESGAGNTVKLANQIVVALNIAAVAEALTLAKKAGVDPDTVVDAIRGGLAGSTVMNAKAPMMIAGSFEPGFKIDLHIKDLDNVLETGHMTGSPLPLTAMVMEMMQTLRADGAGQDDHSALAKYYAKLSGTSI